MREVMVSHMVSTPSETGSGRGTWKLQETGIAVFHQFGVGCEEFESGVGNFSTAIVEWKDGRVESVPIEHVRFVTHNVEVRGEQLAASPAREAGEPRL